jgi:hypothetical protein
MSKTRGIKRSKAQMLLTKVAYDVANLVAYVKELDKILFKMEAAHPEWFPSKDPAKPALTTTTVTLPDKENQNDTQPRNN